MQNSRGVDSTMIGKDDVIYLFVEGDISQTAQICLATHQKIVIP